jgi:uncharacterized protein YecT (DUF1311 family)
MTNMRRYILTTLAGAASLVAPHAVAQTAGAFMTNPAFSDPPPAKCDNTFEMQQCAAHDLRVADAKMSSRYQYLRTHLGASARQRLLVEQRRWLARRDSACMAKGKQYEGGSIAPVVVGRCWVDMTRARYRALMTYR